MAQFNININTGNIVRGVGGFFKGLTEGKSARDQAEEEVDKWKDKGKRVGEDIKGGINKIKNGVGEIFADDSDFDNNGKISPAEKQAARMADADRDGKVELFNGEKKTRQFIDFDGKNGITQNEVDKAKAADRNGDGRISKDERNDFQKMDKNDDGVISKSERSGQKSQSRDDDDKGQDDKKPGFFKKLFSKGDDNDRNDDKKKESSSKSHDKDGNQPSWYQRNIQGMEHKPVKNPEARDFNEDGKTDKTERGAYNSLQDLQRSGKLDERGFKDAVENLHDKCRGQDSSVAATQVRGGQGQGHSQER